MSLRNSHARGFDLKLRRTDQALHETTQRFVESLSKDVRVSQHADLVFAGKKFETEQWYWLHPLPSGRTGYLIFQPRCPVVWMDDQFKQSFRIPMRVSHHVYEKESIMLASLDRSDGLLRIEDCWKLSGEFLRNKPFTQRWEKVHEFFDRMHRPDPVLQQGLRIEPAKFEPLAAAAQWKTTPTLVFAQGETAPRRLRVYFQAKQEEQRPNPIPVVKKSSETPTPKDDITNENIAKAVPHEEYPDTYDLWIQGVKKGYAAVQDLKLSRQLRTAAANATKEKDLFVNIVWNDEFNMYEITGLAN